MFFERGKPTKEVWYYEVAGKFTKGKPIKDSDMEDCRRKYQKREVSENSWLVKAENLKNYDLTAKNPNAKPDPAHKPPAELVREIEEREKKITELLNEIQHLIE